MVWGHPLDPAPRTLLAFAVMVAVLAPLVWLGRQLGSRWGGSTAAVGWAIYVLSEAAHVAELPPTVFVLGAIPVAGWVRRWPGGSWWTIPVLSVLPPMLRPPVDLPSSGDGSTELLLVTVDTIRADAGLLERTGLSTDPAWSTGVATTPAPWTPPAMTSLWLAAGVTKHGGGIEVDGRISQPLDGWHSAWTGGWSDADLEAVASNPYLRRDVGFGGGFDAYWHDDAAREVHIVLHTVDATLQRWTGQDTTLGRTRDERVERLALDRLRAPTAPDVLWVHLLEPHEYARRSAGPSEEARRQAYSRAVQETAERLARLVDAVSPEASVVVLGDHGEALGEEGRWGHGRDLSPEVLLVPLAIRPADSWAGGPVSLVDVGHWLRHVGKHGDLPLRAGPAPLIAGVRGRPSERFAWAPGAQRAVQIAGEVERGPLAPAPSSAVQLALEQLGYVEPGP